MNRTYCSRLLAAALCLLLCAALLPAPAAHADPAGAYAPVLEELQTLLADSEAQYMGSEGFTYMYFMPLYQTVPGAALADLNGDGVPELLLGDLGPAVTEYNATYFYDLYTLVDGVPHHVISSGERYRYSLRADGLISYSGSSGAAYSYGALYRFDGYGLTIISQIYTDGDRGAFYTENAAHDETADRSISMDEWHAISTAYHSNDILPTYTPIDQSPLYLELNVSPRPEDAVFPSVLAQYAAVLADPASYTAEAFPQVSPLMAAALQNATVPMALTYQCKDLNGDGTDELLLGVTRLGEYGQLLGQTVFEVYALQDGAAVPLFDFSALPEAGSAVSLCGDGGLVFFYGANELSHYVLGEDGALILQAHYTSVSDPGAGDARYTADDGSAVSGRDFWAAHGGSVALAGARLP